MSSDLEILLQEYDGVSTTILSEARMACRSGESYLSDLIALCGDARPLMADGATWILKAEIEDGTVIPSDLVALLVDGLGEVGSWAACLHLCQSVEGIALTSDQAEKYRLWAMALADHDRPFLRAWALHAQVYLIVTYALADGAVVGLLGAAGEDKAASVRARARQLQKRFFKV